MSVERGRIGCALALAATVLLLVVSPATASVSRLDAGSRPHAGSRPIGRAEARTLEDLLAALPGRYAAAQSTHDTSLASPVRLISRALAREAAERLEATPGSTAARLVSVLGGLAASMNATRERFQPWPLLFEVESQAELARGLAARVLRPTPAPADRFDALQAKLGTLAPVPLRSPRSVLAALGPFALYSAGPGHRLQSGDPELDARLTRELLLGSAGEPSVAELLAAGEGGRRFAAVLSRARADVEVSGQILGLVNVSRTTVILDGAIIVFREGLEAILILAAITASFTGARRRLRRPVLLGAVAGLAATALTWIVAQLLLHLLGDGGLRLQAITGIVAIAVLLLVTNWFFHRVYWSEWIARFNRRRRSLERIDRVGFISGQALGFALLGLSSVYREGLETVLFLQALQTSAGTGVAAIGAGLGLAATLLVGWLTFRLQRRLPFKKMLVLTGVLIALVLAVMVGTTIHNLQGLGWVSTTPTSFAVPLDLSRWLGVYGTWQGIASQVGALLFVVGSYLAARELKVNGPRRRARRIELAGTRRPSEEALGIGTRVAPVGRAR